MEPPLPIPNREVKHISAYDTPYGGKMGHRQEIPSFKSLHPNFQCEKKKTALQGRFFCALDRPCYNLFTIFMGKESVFDYLPDNNSSDNSTGLSHRKSLYQLNEGVYFVPGVKKASICDTNTGNVYSVNESGKETLLGLQDNKNYLDKLKEGGLLSETGLQTVEREKPEFKLDFAWFEIISDDCNERCVHCYADSMPPTYRKVIGLEEIPLEEIRSKKRKLTASEWKNNIAQSYQLGARNCQFIGGEPFLWKGEAGENVLDLATYAKEMGFEMIEIFTNATLIKESEIQKIKDLDLHIAVSLYSENEAVHDSITRTPGSYKKTVQSLERLRNANILARVETVLMKQNEHTIDSTNEFIEDMGFSHRPPDVLRPKGRGDDISIQPSNESLVRNGLILGPNFNAEASFFKLSTEGHNCLAGKITIIDNGDVLPCIFSRGKVMGNVFEKGNLGNVLAGEIQDVWKTTKEDVLVCQDCEYRYVCFDCRPISEGASNGNGDYKTAPFPRCTYNPYRGEWGGGTWKVDDNGTPFYDESLKKLIDEARELQIPMVKPMGH